LRHEVPFLLKLRLERANLLTRLASQMLFRVVVIEPERGCVRSDRTPTTRRSDDPCVCVGQTMSRAGNRSARAVTF